VIQLTVKFRNAPI